MARISVIVLVLVALLQPVAAAHSLNAPRGVDNLIRNVGDDVTKWLGKDAKVITNEFGDTLVESADGLRQIRFDFNHPYPHKNPHTHLIEYKWVKNK